MEVVVGTFILNLCFKIDLLSTVLNQIVTSLDRIICSVSNLMTLQWTLSSCEMLINDVLVYLVQSAILTHPAD